MGSRVAIVAAKRSIIGSDSGVLKSSTPADLASGVITGLMEESENKNPRFSRDEIRAFISGICVGSNTGQNLPRQVMERCGIRQTETAFAVNEMCGSGLEAIILASNMIRSGEYPAVLAGGVESPSSTPFYLTKDQLKEWQDRTVGEIADSLPRGDLRDALWCSLHDVHTIVHAERTTEKWVAARKYDREAFRKEIDNYAITSSERALKAVEEGYFAEEIIPLFDSSRDEFPRKLKPERLARLRGTHFTPDGFFLTSHNSPPLANGAAYLMLMDLDYALKKGLAPLGIIEGYSRVGVDPEDFLLAPVSAVRSLFEKTGTTVSDYGLFEMNTSYGSQMLINKEELELPMDKVNISGDCLALGHPVGAAGGRILTTLLYGMKRKGVERGLASICLGGGNGLAIAVKREV